jgi:dipeptidase
MKHLRKAIFVALLVFLAAALVASAADRSGRDCFTVLVGKKASADGSVLIAHNEDDYGDIIVNVRKIQPRDYGAPQKVSLGKGGVFETNGKTNGFLWIEATGQEFADSFVNAHGVVITSDSCPSRETRPDFTDGGIGYMLRRIVAEQATSARDAVRLAGELIEKFGYRASGRTYSVADKNEAWMIDVIRGRHWFAERVPDDEVAVIPNNYTIREIRPDDRDFFMGSPDIVEYAQKNGWYDAAKDGPFDFEKAFERPSNRDPLSDGNTLRSWRGLSLLSGRTWKIERDYPFSFKPAKKVTAEFLMGLLRDHCEGTEYDATDAYKTGSPNRTKFRTICTASTINSFVASLNGALPEPISSLVWLAFGKPDTTDYLPVYYGVESLPPGAGLGIRTHDYAAFYKQHFEDAALRAERDKLFQTKVLELQKAAEADYGPMIGKIRRELRPAEKGFIENTRAFEADFSALYAKDREAALKKLDDYVSAAFEKVSGLYGKLLAKTPRP